VSFAIAALDVAGPDRVAVALAEDGALHVDGPQVPGVVDVNRDVDDEIARGSASGASGAPTAPSAAVAIRRRSAGCGEPIGAATAATGGARAARAFGMRESCAGASCPACAGIAGPGSPVTAVAGATASRVAAMSAWISSHLRPRSAFRPRASRPGSTRRRIVGACGGVADARPRMETMKAEFS
jgi:hypothetical protein